MTMAMPMPPAAHMVSMPKLLVLAAEVVDQRRHDAGAGLTERVAEGDGPPWGLIWSLVMRDLAHDRMTCAAKASLSSTKSMVADLLPACSRTLPWPRWARRP